jgi:hypothetical protein
MDREYLAQDRVRELGERFGAAGPLILMALILESGKALPADEVEMRFRSLARLTFVDVETACDVVAAAFESGLLADLQQDAERFRARLTRHKAWDAKDPTSAQRSADYRGRQERD